MPLHNPAGTDVPVPPSTPTPPVIETASVYENPDNRITLATRIEGSSWMVPYYFGQLVGNTDPATLPEDTMDPTLHQYQMIRNLELRVSADLAQTTDPETSATLVVGSANMYPIIIPIIGDSFIGQIQDGSYAKFTITNTERLSIFKQTAYRVDYVMDGYASESVLNALLEKVVSTLYFDVNGLNAPGGALATESEYNRAILRRRYIVDMINRYHQEFYDPVRKTFLVPDDISTVYDPYLVKFWNYFVGEDLRGNNPVPLEFDTTSTIFKAGYVTVWDAVKEQDKNVLTRAVHSMRNLATSVFAANYVYHTLQSSNVDYVVHPQQANGLAITGGTDLPVDPLEPYIFSAAFYAEAPVGQTAFELSVWKMIKREILPFADLEMMYNSLGTLTPYERFYQIPFLITLFIVSR